MSVSQLLAEIRRLDIRLDTQDGHLVVDTPTGVLTEELRTRIMASKLPLLRLLKEERRLREAVNERGLVFRWAEEPGWIVLRDPTTGECYEWPAADCFPSMVEEANRYQAKGGQRE